MWDSYYGDKPFSDTVFYVVNNVHVLFILVHWGGGQRHCIPLLNLFLVAHFISLNLLEWQCMGEGGNHTCFSRYAILPCAPKHTFLGAVPAKVLFPGLRSCIGHMTHVGFLDLGHVALESMRSSRSRRWQHEKGLFCSGSPFVGWGCSPDTFLIYL